MYRRYTLEEVKRKIIKALQDDSAGLSGVELAHKIGINRMTITKYLNILSAIGIIKKKEAGSVNVWYLEPGVIDLEFPVNYIEIQQKFMNAILQSNREEAYRITISAINSTLDKIRILTDVIVPTINTLNELYNRGRVGDTERISLLTALSEILDLIKFNSQPEKKRRNGNMLTVAGSEDTINIAKAGTVALQILGWNSSYIGNVEQHIDPFFDIDFQRYVSKVWSDQRGLMVVCIYSSEESSLRFLSVATKAIKTKLKGELYVILFTLPELVNKFEDIGADFAFNDLQSLIDWSDKIYRDFNSG
jgi:DNA-binding transcriptional regulator YhcF (GntR family)